VVPTSQWRGMRGSEAGTVLLGKSRRWVACCRLMVNQTAIAPMAPRGAWEDHGDVGGGLPGTWRTQIMAILVETSARLVREWRGRAHTVTVTEDGFEYAGVNYPSLTKIAREITGAQWSGPRFFALQARDRGGWNCDGRCFSSGPIPRTLGQKRRQGDISPQGHAVLVILTCGTPGDRCKAHDFRHRLSAGSNRTETAIGCQKSLEGGDGTAGLHRGARPLAARARQQCAKLVGGGESRFLMCHADRTT
jgi:hypothetical protein